MGPPKPNFVQELKSFLLDADNQKLLRDAICTPLLTEIKELKELLQQKDDAIKTLRGRISALEEKNDELEQYTRRNSLRITGIPESEEEDCYKRVLDIANNTLELDPPLTIQDIDRTHRIGPKLSGRSTRPIIVKFATYRQRHRMMTKRNLLRVKAKQVFINEDLTSKQIYVMILA